MFVNGLRYFISSGGMTLHILARVSMETGEFIVAGDPDFFSWYVIRMNAIKYVVII